MKAFADVHVHNFLSNCGKDNTSTAANYVKRYAELGIKTLGFANHVWDDRVPGASKWYSKQTLDFSMQIKPMIPRDTMGVRVLVGAETEYCGMSDTLGMSPEGAKELDFLLIPHTHVHMRDFVMPHVPEYHAAAEKLTKKIMEMGIPEAKAREMALVLKHRDMEPFFEEPRTDYVQYVSDFMVKSFEGLMKNDTLQILCKQLPVSVAHPFQPVGDRDLRDEMLQRISDETFVRLFGMAAQLGVGLEINGACNEPLMLHVLSVAKEQGCKFTLGSDTHSIEGAAGIFKTEPTMEALGITQDDLMDFIK